MSGTYLSTQRVLALLLVGVGVAVIVTTVVHGGGVAARGVLFGVLMVALGLLRLKLARALGPGGER